MPKTIPRTHRSFGGRWSSWSLPVARWKNWPVSLNRPPRRSAIWVRQADRDDDRRDDGLTIVEREEIRRLRREVKQLRLEREILAPPRPQAHQGNQAPLDL